MPKRPIGISVLDAAIQRTAWAFDHYAKVCVSFSGGKDSTVMLHIAADEARKRGRRFGILFIDLEGQYDITIRHVQQCMMMYRDISDPFWVALPIHLRNAVSVYEPHWICWDADKSEAWIRKPPPSAITDTAFFPFFRPGMEFEEFVPEFGAWYGGDSEAACLVGIRSDESLNRYRTVSSKYKECVEGLMWTTVVNDHAVNVYPIYDWRTEDVWTYHGTMPDKPYNRLYDLMYKAGLSIHQMRICQPYGDDQRRGLWLFHLIEPATWGRVVARVNGANSGAMYIQETGNMTGYRRISKPPNHTWQSFAKLLVESMPPATREHYRIKIDVFRRWWMERGYPEGIPDEAPYHLETAKKVPSWRRVCKTLLRNDYWCKGLSFTQHRSEAYGKYLERMRNKEEEWDMTPIGECPYSKIADDGSLTYQMRLPL